MKWKQLFDKGKQIVDQRGGVDSLKGDAEELKKIAGGKGSMKDKAKAAADALKDPGARGGEGGAKAKPHGGGAKAAGGAKGKSHEGGAKAGGTGAKPAEQAPAAPKAKPGDAEGMRPGG